MSGPAEGGGGGQEGAHKTVGVLMPLPLERAYDYAVPADLAPAVAPGAFVRVPLGRLERVGVVWGKGEGDVDPARLKAVTTVLDAPPMTEPLRQLVDWTAEYTLTNRGSVLRMAMSVPGAVESPPVRTAYRLGQGEAPRMTAARERVIALLQKGPPRIATEIAREAAAVLGTDRIAVVHRVGELSVGDVSVAIAVSSPHRAEAYQASRYVIEEIKKRLPVWKKERYSDGMQEWVAGTKPVARPQEADCP